MIALVLHLGRLVLALLQLGDQLDGVVVALNANGRVVDEAGVLAAVLVDEV